MGTMPNLSFLSLFAFVKCETNEYLHFFLPLSLNVANTFQEVMQLYCDRNGQQPGKYSQSLMWLPPKELSFTTHHSQGGSED